MKTLIFFRHGKSDSDADQGVDHERPLARRGREAARTMGRFLGLANLAPDSAVTSSAVRAQTTLELAREAGQWRCPVRVTRALYEATPAAVLREVREERDASSVLLLVGHQPTWSETVSLLAGGGSVRFPTAAMARVDLDVDSWKSAEFGTGELVWLVPPKLFGGGEFDFAR